LELPAVGYFVCHFFALYDFVHFYFDENREENLLQYLAYASFEMTKQSFNQGIYILKAYTTKSTNNEMNSEWNQGQLDRFQMGQAAVLMPLL
jgi:hypothetical protein